MVKNAQKLSSAARTLLSGKIVIIPTDTILGVAASVWSKEAVKRAYQILKRDRKKPFIILISSIKDLTSFDIELDSPTRKILKKIWPGKVSFVLPCPSQKYKYLHRGTKTLAFRIPKKVSLIRLLKITGPLVSTSANPQGKKPAESITEAKKYFDGKIDFFVEAGTLKSAPSTLLKLNKGKISIIRQGSFQVTKSMLK